MTHTKSDDEFVTINIKMGVLKRFRMLKAHYTLEESNGKEVGLSEAMLRAADKEMSIAGLKYTEIEEV